MTHGPARWAIMVALVGISGCASNPEPPNKASGMQPAESPAAPSSGELHHRVARVSMPDDGPATIQEGYRHVIARGDPPVAVAAPAEGDGDEVGRRSSTPQEDSGGDAAASGTDVAANNGGSRPAKASAEDSSGPTGIPESVWETYCAGAPAALSRTNRAAIAEWQSQHHATAPERFQPCRSPK